MVGKVIIQVSYLVSDFFFFKGRIQKKNNNVKVHFLRAKVKHLLYRRFYITMAMIQIGAKGSV